MIDSHFHPQLLGQEFPGCLDLAMKNGVTKMIMVSLKTADAALLQHYAEIYHELYFAVGIHPLDHTDIASLELIVPYLQHPKCIAIGETGLDYYRDLNEQSQDAQRQLFRAHLMYAAQYNKPVIVHSRNAESDTLSIIAQFPQVRGVLHCFTGSENMANNLLAYNYYISFSGIITFKSASDLQQLVTKLPLNRILIETDAPYLSPQHPNSRRSEKNLPHKVAYVAEKIAQLRQQSLLVVQKHTHINTCNLFNLPLI